MKITLAIMFVILVVVFFIPFKQECGMKFGSQDSSSMSFLPPEEQWTCEKVSVFSMLLKAIRS